MGVWISFQRFVKSLEHKRIVISVTENIGNDSPVAQVQNGTQKDFMYRDSLIPLEFRYIRKPFLVGTLCMKVAVQYVLSQELCVFCTAGTAVICVLNGRLNTLFLANTADSFIIYLDMVIVFQVVVDSTIPFIRVLHMDAFYDFRNSFVCFCPLAFFPRSQR